MKWKKKEEPELPNIGDIRRQTIFALLPHEATDGVTYWLEKVVEVQRFCGADSDWTTSFIWITVRYEPLEVNDGLQ